MGLRQEPSRPHCAILCLGEAAVDHSSGWPEQGVTLVSVALRAAGKLSRERISSRRQGGRRVNLASDTLRLLSSPYLPPGADHLG
jgi:hypothetical protein